MVTDNQYEEVGRLAVSKFRDICSDYTRDVGIGQFSYYRFGVWIEDNYIDSFEELLELVRDGGVEPTQNT